MSILKLSLSDYFFFALLRLHPENVMKISMKNKTENIYTIFTCVMSLNNLKKICQKLTLLILNHFLTNRWPFFHTSEDLDMN